MPASAESSPIASPAAAEGMRFGLFGMGALQRLALSVALSALVLAAALWAIGG